VIILKKLREELHQNHSDVTEMKWIARNCMWWPGLDTEIENVAKTCQSCQVVKRAPPLAVGVAIEEFISILWGLSRIPCS